jgi:hypothetical protein
MDSQEGAVLSGVLAQIVGSSLHPEMWKAHWEKSSKLVLASLFVSQGTTMLTGGYMDPLMLFEVACAAIVVRTFILPAGYVSIVILAYLFLGHAGNVHRILHEAYILVPWWFSNKLLVNDDAEAHIPHYLETLKADPATVALAEEFVHARKGGMDITNAEDIAHHCGVLVLYSHSFGPAVRTGPDWPHLVMHTCYCRILDDYQDMEEDIRDGNAHRNFLLRLQEHHQDQYGTNNYPKELLIKQVVVQAMRAMLWHEEQIQDSGAQNYARSFIQSFEALMLFKTDAVKQEWKEARAEALRGATMGGSQAPPSFEWPFQSLTEPCVG